MKGSWKTWWIGMGSGSALGDAFRQFHGFLFATTLDQLGPTHQPGVFHPLQVPSSARRKEPRGRRGVEKPNRPRQVRSYGGKNRSGVINRLHWVCLVARNRTRSRVERPGRAAMWMDLRECGEHGRWDQDVAD